MFFLVLASSVQVQGAAAAAATAAFNDPACMPLPLHVKCVEFAAFLGCDPTFGPLLVHVHT